MVDAERQSGRLRRRGRRQLSPERRPSSGPCCDSNIPTEVRAIGRSHGGRTKAQRDKLRRRLQLIAMQARFARDPKRDEEDRERGARMRRRYEMQAMVEAVKADDRAVDAAERAAVRRWQEQLYYDRNRGIPLQQSRETFARLEAGRAAGKGRLR